ncbi:glycosyltransferase family 4 protein [Arthrobacter sp. zg-Y20]|uniref:MraY family glycosyltransferase n=1 Tax=unclassified Arthrobacter TaxID=235627 RepID=UPI001D14FB69|nr:MULTISPECIES: glycosyltransferase family 4 protein [unclassified Arthrobacter]MCC3276937.1 glycosyltransferase family 4 protein [Arthrobacter sp. zg-Y20]MDK1317098.1 glycosyltransferase family 4 protein [Arthrobacter sp. zg.Y20]WIB05195.1 glycosyltransferase family 4 protein [Arthrobacter sp. zg-Y20]
MLLAVCTAAAFLISLLLPFVFIPLLRRLGVLDVPNERSSHTTVVIRGVGLTVAAGVLAGLVLSLATGLVSVDRSIVAILIAVIGLASLLGWIEDWRGVSVRTRAGSQLVIGLAGTAALAWTMEQSWWWVPVGGVAIAAYINVANFMDGINGISGLHGLVVGVLYSISGVLSDHVWLTVAGAVTAAAFAAFLPWNLGRGQVFLGDVGSYLLGASVAGTAVAAFLAGVYVEYLLFPLLVYLADTFSTLLRRVRRGERWYTAHRQHVYQRLTDAGLSHVQVSLLVTGCTLVVGLAGLFTAGAGAGATLAGVLFAVAVVVFYLASPALFVRRYAQ